MKLKQLPLRAYNILFHTHTVTGIVLSFGLFVIFFAGAFSLFRYEIYPWENQNVRRVQTEGEVQLEKALELIRTAHPDFDDQQQFTFRMPDEKSPLLRFFGGKKPVDSLSRGKRFRMAFVPGTMKIIPDDPPPTTLSNTLYRLHYFAHLPAGLWISGFVAVFFLFAIFTGVLIHWQHIIKRFYAFSIRTTAKQIWTLGHTTMGMIGFPFQVVYAVTGALFGLLTLLLAPSALVLFDGDTNQVLAAVMPERVAVADSLNADLSQVSLDELYASTQRSFTDYPVEFLRVSHYGTPEGVATFYVDDGNTLTGNGALAVGLAGGKEIVRVDPAEKGYSSSVYNLLTKLHFASFGGLLIKFLYFLLAMVTCFMLISGILLWQRARNNSRYTDRQRKFHLRVTKIFICICMALFPATALIFLANKLVPFGIPQHTFYVNAIFFIGWLLLTVGGTFLKDLAAMFRAYFWSGALLAICIPLANGIVTGDWLWQTVSQGQYYVAAVDLFWLATGLLIGGLLLSRSTVWKDVPTPLPN